MGIENYSEDIIVATLPEEPELRRELTMVNEIIANKGGRDVIIDFRMVEILTSSSISNLLLLRDLLRESGRRLVLCNVASPTKGIFRVAGLREDFDFVDNKSAALECIELARKK